MCSIGISHLIVHFTESVCVIIETLPVLAVRITPLHLRKSGKTWKKHIFKVLACCDVFCPEICLNSLYMRLLLVCHSVHIRLIRITFLNRKVSADAERLVCDVLCLIIIQIIICIRSHDGIVSETHCFQTAGLTSP